MADLPRQNGRTSVMHIITRFDQGGSARNTFLTVMGHDRSRFRISLAYGCVEAHGAEDAALLEKDMSRLRQAGVALFEVPSLAREVRPLRDAQATLALWRVLRRERPAIVHTHTSKAGAVGRVAAWLAGIPVVIHTPHGHIFYGYYGPVMSGLIRLVERALARITDRIVTLTERGIAEHVRLGIARADKFTAIPSGIALSAFRSVRIEPAVKRKELGLPPEGPVIGTVGRLVPIKGHEWLLKAAPQVLAEFPRATFVFLGEGPLLGRLQQVAGELGISGHVLFLGARQDVPECLAAFDLFAFPSLNEGMGRALIEAMAVGLPVVATHVGGIPDVVAEGVNGLLVPPEDERALAAAILALLRDPGRMGAFGEAAGRSVGERFEAASTIREIERLYDAVWHEKHATP
jgi:glycosyltransferase involved in cell wall biosynthesis